MSIINLEFFLIYFLVEKGIIDMTTFERVKFLCERRKISLNDLETTLGFSKNSIIKWKKTNPSSDKLGKVADFFDVSVDYLLGRGSDAEFEAFQDDPELQLFMRELADSPEARLRQLRGIWEVLKQEHKND